jgi:hypothetical protein
MQTVGRGLQQDKDRGHEWPALQEAIANEACGATAFAHGRHIYRRAFYPSTSV